TWTNDDNPSFPGSGAPNRGIGYSYSTDGGNTWSAQEDRVGGIPLYWPSYAQWGTNGEAILARSARSYEHEGMQILNGLVLLTRENKGVGEWTRRVVPYPAGTPSEDGWIMAWSRMTTSGDNHQYIQFMTHTRWGDGGKLYEGYTEPVFYYRTADGGETWDVAGKLVPDEITDIVWDKGSNPEGRICPSYTDQISVASHGDVVAASFVRYGYHSYVLKSVDNGETWTATQFFRSSIYAEDSEQYADTCYIPTQGNVAVDNKGKVHVAFGTWMIDDQYRYTGFFSSFLSYWNEGMDPFDVDDFIKNDVDNVIFDKFIDGDLSDLVSGKLYVKSTTPEWPIIGFYVPLNDDHYFNGPLLDGFSWIQDSYGMAGTFSFPQMAFDADNTMHLTYLGIADDKPDGNTRWFRHPYHTTRTEDGIWTETKYLVSFIDVIDREFAYLTLAGLYDNKMFLMAQVDQYAGVFTPYVYPGPPDHGQTTNYFYSFYAYPVPTDAINEIDYTPLNIGVYPNPAEGQVTVDLKERKGDITVYNMLGQVVYHAENVENKQNISLSNMTTGVYFVTVRSGNATATQKLIVK
ncbi:MAG: T9SS type A sorting domain-containing protein, partial [Bacteroidales bacterium]|nr:T9SS type A sorting domain-containing protein [Bacteroidales bacterium]